MSDRRMRGDRREPSKPDRRNDVKSREAFDEITAEPHGQWDGYNYAFRDGIRRGLRKFREVGGRRDA
jgi:hypothetical protein